MKKIKNSQPQTKFTGSYKKRVYFASNQDVCKKHPLREIPQSKNVSAILLHLFFLNQLSDLLCMIAISADDTTLNSTCNKACDLSEQIEMRCNLISKIKCFGEYFYFSSATF